MRPWPDRERTSLRIGFLIRDIDACGGMERQAALLAARLSGRGHRVLVLSDDPRDASLAALVPRAPERREAYEVARIPALRGVPAEVAREVSLLLAGLALRRQGGVDVLYALHIASCPAARDLGRLVGAPWAVKLACGGAPGDVALARREPEGPDQLEGLRRADRVVCLSRQIEAEARSVGVPSERLAHIPNGVDVAALVASSASPAEGLDLPPGALPILYAGRFDAEKRVEVLLAAMVRLGAVQPQACLLLAGRAGPAQDRLRELARTLGVEPRVRFLGLRDDVPRLLKLARVFVLPSAAEGMSNALLEALALGTPVVTTRIPANQEVVDDDSAWLVPVDDDQALAAALAAALAGGPAGARRVEQGRRVVAERFEIGQVALRYEALFQQLRSRERPQTQVRAVLRERSRHTRDWVLERGAAWADDRRRVVSEAVVRVKRWLGRG